MSVGNAWVTTITFLVVLRGLVLVALKVLVLVVLVVRIVVLIATIFEAVIAVINVVPLIYTLQWYLRLPLVHVFKLR